MRDNRKTLNTYRKILGRNEKCHRTLLLEWWEYPFSQIWRDYAFTLLIIVRSLNPTILWSYGSTSIIKIPTEYLNACLLFLSLFSSCSLSWILYFALAFSLLIKFFLTYQKKKKKKKSQQNYSLDSWIWIPLTDLPIQKMLLPCLLKNNFSYTTINPPPTPALPNKSQNEDKPSKQLQ